MQNRQSLITKVYHKIWQIYKQSVTSKSVPVSLNSLCKTNQLR